MEKNGKSHFLIRGLFVGLLAMTLTACGGGEETADNGDDSDKIVLGGIMPLTGDAASLGLEFQAVAEIALDKINENGGVDGKELEIIWEDGKCTGNDAAAAAQKLINVDEVSVILGGLCSDETLGAAPIAEDAGVVLLSPASSSPKVTTAGDYIFRNYPADTAQSQIFADVAAELGVTKVGIITEETDYAISIEEMFVVAAEENGLEVVEESFLSSDTDLKTQLTTMKSEGIEALLVNVQTPEKTDLIFKQMDELGTAEGLQLMGNDVVLGSAETIDRYPELFEGLIGAQTSYNAEHPDFVEFNELYEEQEGVEIAFPTYSSTTYDAVMLLAELIGEVGNDADALRDALYAVDGWEGTAGMLTIDENGDPTSGHVAKVIVDGEVMDYSAEMMEEMEDTDVEGEDAGAAIEDAEVEEGETTEG